MENVAILVLCSQDCNVMASFSNERYFPLDIQLLYAGKCRGVKELSRALNIIASIKIYARTEENEPQ